MKIFMSITTIIICITAILIPKKISQLELYTSNLFILFIVAMLDMIFITKLHMYGYISDGIDWFAIPVLVIVYPSINTITLNFFKTIDGFKKKVGYTIFIALIYTVTEWIFLKVGFLYYSGWKLWYSLIAYLLVVTLIEVHLQLIKNQAQRLIRESK